MKLESHSPLFHLVNHPTQAHNIILTLLVFWYPLCFLCCVILRIITKCQLTISNILNKQHTTFFRELASPNSSSNSFDNINGLCFPSNCTSCCSDSKKLDPANNNCSHNVSACHSTNYTAANHYLYYHDYNHVNTYYHNPYYT